jgi:hypothetical protein
MQDYQKLEALKKTFTGAKLLDMQGKERYSIKVEPGMEF